MGISSDNIIKKYFPPVILGAAILIIWQLSADAVNMGHVLPGPVQIVIRTWELRESLFFHHLPQTLLTIVCGWALSVAIGITLAVLMHFSPVIEAMLHSALIITQTIPVMCISPLFVLWLGYTMGARLIAVVLSTFFAITLNTYDGLQGTDEKKRELLRSFGAGRLEIFLKLEVPSAFPKLVTALKMTIPWAVIDAAVAEWLGANQGLGYFSKRMISKMDGAAVFAPILILSVMALIGMAVIKLIDKKYASYRNEL
ncbi:MAG: ABC transporter permease [Eubacteriales bacterium]|nr:ABC transporter permease [Eubacteriales bacterium]